MALRSRNPGGGDPPDDGMADAGRPDMRMAHYVLSPECERRLTEADAPCPMIIEINFNPVEDAAVAKNRIRDLLLEVGVSAERIQPLDLSYNYIFVDLDKDEVMALVKEDRKRAKNDPRLQLIRRIWPDEELTAYIFRSVRTIKADACRVAFGSEGDGIVWAILDSGIEKKHPHFQLHGNLDLPGGLQHKNFVRGEKDQDALSDAFGHGTHVAGILAGETLPKVAASRKRKNPKTAGNPADGFDIWKLSVHRKESIGPSGEDRSEPITRVEQFSAPLRGVAPRCKLMSLKVLDGEGKGYASALIAALEYVAMVNGDGRNVRVHGVNLSVGYPFDAAWYAAGHTPACMVVNRVSKDGAVVVAAAGNDGSIMSKTELRADTRRIGVGQSITDPGNADEAITVGSTHAEAPHTYGVSYFSSRGPTADGRSKPDLVAPGERIVSAASTDASSFQETLRDAGHTFDEAAAYFREDSGTSMAAPHVSGSAAALMSVKVEAKGNSTMVKDLLMRSCTDLRRKTDFQGAGLIDLLRALQIG